MHAFETGFVVQIPAWHGLAKVVQDPPATSREAMVLAGCDWQVETRPLFVLPDEAILGEHNTEVVDPALPTDSAASALRRSRRAPAYATVRVTDRRILGVVGEEYTVVQNEKAFSFFDPFLARKELAFESAGALWGGSRVFVQARVLGSEADVLPGDPVRPYLLLSNSHDGSLAVDVRFTPVRVVCHNTLSAALNDDEKAPRLSVRHTSGVEDALEAIQGVVEVTKRAFETSMEQYRFLASREVKGLETVYVRRLMGKADDEPFRSEAKVVELMHAGVGQDIAGVAGTWWGAFNGVAEWIDYRRGRDQSRREQAWYGVGAATRERALHLALEMAGGQATAAA